MVFATKTLAFQLEGAVVSLSESSGHPWCWQAMETGVGQADVSGLIKSYINGTW